MQVGPRLLKNIEAEGKRLGDYEDVTRLLGYREMQSGGNKKETHECALIARVSKICV